MNNRQNGRRRGRGGQQARNGQPGNPHSNSRVDNRQRGNAAQLLEKYKTLARDSQMQGDRVTTEYYLQFADHYFRVVSETRSRYEEQRRPREDYGSDEEADQAQRGYAPQNFADDGWDDGEDERDGDQQPHAQQSPQQPRYQQPQQAEPQQQPQQGQQPQSQQPQSQQPQSRPQRTFQPRGDRRPPHAAQANGNGQGAPGAEPVPAPGFAPGADFAASGPARIEIELPPALSSKPAEEPAVAAGAEGEAAPKRRRTRKPKAPDVAQAEA